MAKKSALEIALDSAAGKKQAAAKGPAIVPTRTSSTTVLIGANFAPEVREALDMVLGKMGRRRTVKQALGEAINDLCAKYGVPEPFSEEA